MKVKVKLRCRACKYEFIQETEDVAASTRIGYCPKCLTGGSIKGGPLYIVEVIKDGEKQTP